MDCGTPTASLLAVKLLLNSVISTDSARFMSIDTKDFYLNTSMERPEFLRLNIKKFPEDVIQHYSQVKPLHRMCQRNVWLVSCGHNCAETAGGEIEPGRVLSKCPNARLLETQVAASVLLADRR